MHVGTCWYPCVMKQAETSGVMMSRFDDSRFHFCTKLWAVLTRDRHCYARYGQPIGWRHLRTGFVCIHSVLCSWLSPHTDHCLQFVDVTTVCEGGRGGPRAGLNTEARGKTLSPRRGSNPGRPARSQTLYCQKLGVIFNPSAIYVFVLWSVQVYPAVLLMYFISAAVVLVASLDLMVQFSLPYNKVGRSGVLRNFILVFFGRNALFITSVIFRKYQQ
jgi:hypothetical protein